ncbi:relaxase/mobilization nuclease domain-containing protein [Mucilaginibacter paludis]|uniref:Relaxase/mobilization nuclease family protein n=1 Tax=Mucilaginibacter paludis DSM 18603 TaxID=714943 RepID=H1Y5M4_9SPHI|nr:relaxase/mobilization nuclease domain-containing protein [Mucilaginibacter paludis]EHQ29800.1 Relaxase/mobilization nuclease family protein [Mucilaginibacter paludis DSM 18603]
MILRVDIRGNGAQLSNYLMALGDNSQVEILEIDGRETSDLDYLYQTIISMELNSELTKTDKAFFHAQINPAYGEDKAMTREDWYLAADILAKGTGYENQRRVITLHTKKGRTHAHVVWERYNHETGKMIDNKNSKYKADATRSIMEQALGHKQTPYRNPHRFDLKQAATELWNKTTTGAEFIKEARKAGYMVAAGTGNRPFMIVDGTGRAFDLVRQLDGVRTKEVRARLRHEPLITDKQAIELMREQSSKSGKTEQQKQEQKPSATNIAKDFADNRSDGTKEDAQVTNQRKFDQVFEEFKAASKEATKPAEPDKTEQERKQEAAQQFAENKSKTVNQPTPQELERQKIVAEQERIKQRSLQRKRHR